MAGPTRISELSDGSPIQPTDQVPVARGSGATGYTYKVNAGRFVSDLFNVANTSTVDLAFDTSTRTLCAAANTSVNVVDSPTIDLDWNASTRTLSADVSTAVKEASAFNVVDSPTIDLDWNASTRTLSAVTTSMVATSSSPMVAKAYVDFWVADLGNPVQAYNISSITDIGTISLAGTTGTGLRVNFTTPMPTAKYSVFTGDYNGYCSLAADTGTIYVQPDGSQTANSFILFNAGAGRTRFRYRAIVFYNP